MTTFSELTGGAPVWPGAMDRSLMSRQQFAAGRYLADVAKRARWGKVLHELDTAPGLVNVRQWRPGGTTWLTVLHQAGWNGAPLDVATQLIVRGALRSQPDAQGRTAHDVAVQHGRPAELLELLAPPPSPLDRDRIDALDSQLTALIDDLIQQLFGEANLRKLFRYPPVEVLHEAKGGQLWFPVPYLWGGFRVSLRGDELEVLGGYREQRPSGGVGVATTGYLVSPTGAVQISESYS